jgi:hypothetical protein
MERGLEAAVPLRSRKEKRKKKERRGLSIFGDGGAIDDEACWALLQTRLTSLD